MSNLSLIYQIYRVIYRRGVFAIKLSLMHKFIQKNSGSAQVQILLKAYQRFAMVRVSGNGSG